MSADSGKLRKFNVTGGMASKIKLLYKISRDTGAKCVIFNATVEGRLSEVLNRKTTNFTLIDAKDRE
jgi:isopentenyl phosphate kinase